MPVEERARAQGDEHRAEAGDGEVGGPPAAPVPEHAAEERRGVDDPHHQREEGERVEGHHAAPRPATSPRPMHEFMFATGIENSYPTVALPDGSTMRVDEMQKTGHYERWREDFGLVVEMGIPFLRYGPPYYRTHLGPGRYDWSFADETFNALSELGITPIVDLCHFGIPDWLGG